MLANEHQGHAASIALFAPDLTHVYAMAAHSFAETYTTLTRTGPHAPYRFTPDEAWLGLASLRASVKLVGLTAAQSLDAIHGYAVRGGVGARLYDALIGEAAVVHGIGTIVTWNITHMAGLFPRLEVVTPDDFLRARKR